MKRSQDSGSKQAYLNFESKFQIFFFFWWPTKNTCLKCLVIYLGLILCFFLNVCKEVKLIYHLTVAQNLRYKVNHEEIEKLGFFVADVSAHFSKHF